MEHSIIFFLIIMRSHVKLTPLAIEQTLYFFSRLIAHSKDCQDDISKSGF